jgi:fatty acid/phospholipid biosynthesis enzyme
MAAKINETVEFDLEAMRAREAQIALESDQDILDRMRANFQILEDMTGAVKAGEVRAMIVSGPPGCLPGATKVNIRIL